MPLSLWIMLPVTAALVLIPCIYSYRFYKTKEEK
jgi:hypothetical protein